MLSTFAYLIERNGCNIGRLKVLKVMNPSVFRYFKMLKIVKFSALLIFANLVAGCVEATGDNKNEQEDVVSSVKPELKADASQTKEDAIRAILAKTVGPIPIKKIKKSTLPSFYEVYATGQVIYISEDLKYIFPGPLLSIGEQGLVNLTQEGVRQLDAEFAPERARIMADVSEKDMVVFKAPEEKYVVNVFTDVDCPYCRKLHQQMSGYNKHGITIRYLAFPRAGIGSGAYNKLVSIWCSDNKQSAMDDAKLRNKFEPKECDSPVPDQYSLTRELQLTGTPALILPSGQLISGFLEPDQLHQVLSQSNG